MVLPVGVTSWVQILHWVQPTVGQNTQSPLEFCRPLGLTPLCMHLFHIPYPFRDVEIHRAVMKTKYWHNAWHTVRIAEWKLLSSPFASA